MTDAKVQITRAGLLSKVIPALFKIVVARRVGIRKKLTF